jgi:hypothetical protein
VCCSNGSLFWVGAGSRARQSQGSFYEHGP